MNGSLQFRLAWRLAFVFSAVILATSFAILLHRGSGNADIPRDELMESIDQVRAGLSLGADGKPRLDLPANPGFRLCGRTLRRPTPLRLRQAAAGSAGGLVSGFLREGEAERWPPARSTAPSAR